MDGLMLTSENNKKIADEVLIQLLKHTEDSKSVQAEGHLSSTFTPFFDITLKEGQKGKLEEVQVSSLIKDKVKNY